MTMRKIFTDATKRFFLVFGGTLTGLASGVTISEASGLGSPLPYQGAAGIAAIFVAAVGIALFYTCIRALVEIGEFVDEKFEDHRGGSANKKLR